MSRGRGLLERPIRRQPIGQRVEIDEVGIELRAVDTGIASLAPDGHATAAAHAGPVDHDRVE
jgi:hypothetical protein